MKNKSLKKNVVLSALRTVIMLLIPLVQFPYASRILGTDGVGKAQYIQSIATYFQLFATSGISYYAIREGVKVRDDNKRLGKFVSEMLLFNCITTGIALLAYSILFWIPGLRDYRSLLLVFIVFIVCNGINLDWFFNILEDFQYITLRTFVIYISSIFLMFCILHNSNDVNCYAIVIVFPYAGILLSNLNKVRRTVPLLQYHKYRIKVHVKPILVVFLITVSSSIYLLLDTTMLGIMCSDRDVGLYSAASKLSKMVVQVILAICSVFLPRLSYYIGVKDNISFRRLASDCVRLIMLLVIPCMFGLIVLAPEAILLFSGRDFIDAIGALKILAVNMVFSALNGFLGWHILVPNNKERFLLLATIAGAGVDFLLNLLFIPQFGIEGAAVSTLFAETVVFLVCALTSLKLFNLKNIAINVIWYVLASISILVISFFCGRLEIHFILKCVLVIGLSVMCYFSILLLSGDTIVRRGLQWGMMLIEKLKNSKAKMR